jgi:hypothetical protein
VLGIRITYTHNGAVPPSPEVLRQGVLGVTDRTGLAVEHLWVGADDGRCHVVLFLRDTEVDAALATCRALARTIEECTAGIRFLGCAPVLP